MGAVEGTGIAVLAIGDRTGEGYQLTSYYCVAGICLKAETVFAAGKTGSYIARVFKTGGIDKAEADSAFETKGYVGVADLAVGYGKALCQKALESILGGQEVGYAFRTSEFLGFPIVDEFAVLYGGEDAFLVPLVKGVSFLTQ